jgi:hypothetical protein
MFGDERRKMRRDAVPDWTYSAAKATHMHTAFHFLISKRGAAPPPPASPMATSSPCEPTQNKRSEVQHKRRRDRFGSGSMRAYLLLLLRHLIEALVWLEDGLSWL